MAEGDPPVAAPTPYFTPEEPPQNCDAKLWRLICLRVHALNDALVDALQECARLRADASRVAAPTPHRNPETGEHRFEDEAMEVVKAIHRDYAPDLDSNDGGQILVWILELCDLVYEARVAAPTPETQADAGYRATAGDALIRAVNEWMPHATSCNRDDCPVCVTLINRLRLAYKVWQVSAHKGATTELIERVAAPTPETPSLMTFQRFSIANRERCESPHGFNHRLDAWSTSDWFVAVIGELGEAANVVKKLNRVRDGVPGNKETPDVLRDKLRQELGDAFVYLDLIAQSLGFLIAEAAVEVFDKKSVQIGYPDPPLAGAVSHPQPEASRE